MRSRRSHRILETCVAGLALAVTWAAAEPGPAAAITLEPVVTGLASPVFVTHAGDGSGRLFIVQQGGQVLVLNAGATSPTTFLSITGRVLSGGERGLLGLAFHPQYETNRRFFVNYTRQTDGATVIAEYHASAADPNVADPAEIVLLTIAQPFANHNGGMIAFGPDGFLYIGMGDGGSANDPGNRAQNVNELLGKMLRIDVNTPASPTQLYSSPPDNPFAGAIPGRDEIYAVGLRNPWRFSFDRLNGNLFAGDVGQGAREEVDRIVRGGNYGWRTFEGTRCTMLDPSCDPSPFVAPIAEYDHSGGRCSVTGGYAYRGSRGTFPPGAYVYGDYCSGEVFLLTTQVEFLGFSFANISSFGEDEEGELYLVNHNGAVSRFTAASTCSFAIDPPALAFSAAGGTGTVNVTTAADCEWDASDDADWITVTVGVSGTGPGTVRYDVAPNSTPRPRTGIVRIAGRIHAVRQAAPPRCVAALEPRRVLAPVEGATGTIAVNAPDGCAWTVSSPVPWILITSPGDGEGAGFVQYLVDLNPGTAPRRARLAIGGRILAVRQSGPPR